MNEKMHKFINSILGAGKNKNNLNHPLRVFRNQLEDDAKKGEKPAVIYQQKFAHKEEARK